MHHEECPFTVHQRAVSQPGNEVFSIRRVEDLEFEKRFSHPVHSVEIRAKEFIGALGSLRDHSLYFIIDRFSGLFAVVPAVSHVSAEEDLFLFLPIG